jgi:hypothetical protein
MTGYPKYDKNMAEVSKIRKMAYLSDIMVPLFLLDVFHGTSTIRLQVRDTSSQHWS